MTSASLKKILMISVIASANTAFAMGSRDPASKETVLAARWEGKHKDGRDWTLATHSQVEKITPGLLSTTPSDYKDFCPQYSGMSHAERKNFWVHLLSSMAQFESNFNPSLSYREAFRDSSGNRVVSRGLLQISIESGNAYGCGFRSNADLNDPYKNLNCGLRILNRWVSSDKRIAGYVGGAWKGGARYWSVLRTKEKVKSIKTWTRDFCSAKF